MISAWMCFTPMLLLRLQLCSRSPDPLAMSSKEDVLVEEPCALDGTEEQDVLVEEPCEL